MHRKLRREKELLRHTAEELKHKAAEKFDEAKEKVKELAEETGKRAHDAKEKLLEKLHEYEQGTHYHLKQHGVQDTTKECAMKADDILREAKSLAQAGDEVRSSFRVCPYVCLSV